MLIPIIGMTAFGLVILAFWMCALVPSIDRRLRWFDNPNVTFWVFESIILMGSECSMGLPTRGLANPEISIGFRAVKAQRSRVRRPMLRQ